MNTNRLYVIKIYRNELSEVKEKLAGQHARVRLFEKKGLDEEVIVAERIVEQHLRIKMVSLFDIVIRKLSYYFCIITA